MKGISVFLPIAAFFYPIYWLSLLIVRAGPALLHVAFLRHRLLAFEFGPLWIETACCPPGAAATHENMRTSPILEAGIVLVTASIVFIALRRHRAVGGLLIAAIGQAALTGPLLSLFFGQRYTTAVIAAACAFAAVILVGLALLSSSVNDGIWNRLIAPFIVFCLPLAIFSSALLRLGAGWPIVPIFVAPSLLLAPLAAICAAAILNQPVAEASPPTPRLTLRRLTAGLAATIIFIGLIRAGQNARRRSLNATGAAFLATLPKPAPAAPYPKMFFQR